MRQDIGKVITETYKVRFHRDMGKYPRSSRKGSRYLSDVGGKIGTRKIHNIHGESRTFGENLSPLRRFLESRVGKKWDEVYSEIKSTVPNNGTVQNHVYQHLFDFVDFPREIRKSPRGNGKLEGIGIRRGFMYSESFSSAERDWAELHNLYVDPDTNVLKRSPEGVTWNQRARNLKRDRDLALKSVYIRQDGYDLFREGSLWFRAKLEKQVSEVVVIKPTWLNRFEEANWDSYSEEEKIKAGGYRIHIYRHNQRFSSSVEWRVRKVVHPDQHRDVKMVDKDGNHLVYTNVFQLSSKEIKRLKLPVV